MSLLDQLLQEFEEYGDLHDQINCGVMQEDACDCDMHGAKDFLTSAYARIREEILNNMNGIVFEDNDQIRQKKTNRDQYEDFEKLLYEIDNAEQRSISEKMREGK